MLLTLATFFLIRQKILNDKKDNNKDKLKSSETSEYIKMSEYIGIGLAIGITEFLFLFLALYVALKCADFNEKYAEVHIFMAIFFPIPYLIYVFLTGCYRPPGYEKYKTLEREREKVLESEWSD